MGIEKLKESLLSEAKDEAQQIVQSAQSHVDGMLREEKAKETALRQNAEKKVEKLLEDQRNERIAWARLEAKRINAEAREDAIKNVFEDFFNELANSRKSPEYKKFIKDAIPAAAADLGGKVTVHVVKGDKVLVPKSKNIKIVEDLKGLGGALVENSTGRIRVDLRLETLADSKRDEIRRQIATVIFGGK
ncbi:V-type ATP synthase subunit E [Candidatus Micrarchaeota archaeon]|nr:V-type ATP synthase subunit E [Candidatus Micrarchaeota archaeon]MBU1682226.1 V-type ATP synthase subunit E [Candidatus Micrarchaeota archaeon]